MHTRQAAAFAAVEATGLSKSEIARIAGIHRSQVSRWVSGDQRPSYERTMRLAAHLRREHPDVADELVAAAGYGPPGPEPEPDVLAEQLGQEAAERVRRVLGKRGETGAALLAEMERVFRKPGKEAGGQSPPARAAG